MVFCIRECIDARVASDAEFLRERLNARAYLFYDRRQHDRRRRGSEIDAGAALEFFLDAQDLAFGNRDGRIESMQPPSAGGQTRDHADGYFDHAAYAPVFEPVSLDPQDIGLDKAFEDEMRRRLRRHFDEFFLIPECASRHTENGAAHDVEVRC